MNIFIRVFCLKHLAINKLISNVILCNIKLTFCVFEIHFYVDILYRILYSYTHTYYVIDPYRLKKI